MAGLLQIAVSAHEPLHFLIHHFHEKEYSDVNYVINGPVGLLTPNEVTRIRYLAKMRLNSLTKGLLEIGQGGAVQFVHQTVKDWLMTTQMREYLKNKSAANFNEPLALLRAHLAWYKQPNQSFFDTNFWDLAESGTNSASFLYEINEKCLTVAAEGVLDGFVRATERLWKRRMTQKREDVRHETVNNLKLLELFSGAELWSYICEKLDETSDFLIRFIDKPGSIGLEQLQGAIKEDDKSLVSEVATDLLGPLMTKTIPRNLLDPMIQQRKQEYHLPEAHRNKVLQAAFSLTGKLDADPDTLIRAGSGPERSVPAWTYILLYPFATNLDEADQIPLQALKDALETVMDSLDRDYYKLLEPMSGKENDTAWDVLCGHVYNLGHLRQSPANVDTMAAPLDFQAEALAICIEKLSYTGRDYP
ncbi:hypothetical protein Daus18300_013755 [Diaporthe australafricana]|uniref:DUF7791 domain-containing protein n=1 Tax=Diaporthe australafricana TaxID=127596 RepID=A0ABR3VXX8_9PEZI